MKQVFQGHPFISGGWWRLKMTSQGGRSCVVGVQRPDWLLSGTLFMDHNAAKCITLCLNMSQGWKSGHMVVVTHDSGLVQRPDWDTFYRQQCCQAFCWCWFESSPEVEKYITWWSKTCGSAKRPVEQDRVADFFDLLFDIHTDWSAYFQNTRITWNTTEWILRLSIH